MSFVSRTQVRFAHVDAAGIVFYPRYFEMINAAVEDFFSEAVGIGFAALHQERGLGVPTVRLEAEFETPSRLGDTLDIAVTIERIGESSCSFRFDVCSDGQVRLTARSVLVCMDLASGRPTPWPVDIRHQLVSRTAGGSVSSISA